MEEGVCEKYVKVEKFSLVMLTYWLNVTVILEVFFQTGNKNEEMCQSTSRCMF